MSSSATTVFDYPSVPHPRRHGPQGFLDYKHYKPWLRDDYSFRCVYCLCRETWLPDGQAYFGTDHVWPRSRVREGRCAQGLAGVLTIQQAVQAGRDGFRQSETSQISRQIDFDGQGHGNLRIRGDRGILRYRGPSGVAMRSVRPARA